VELKETVCARQQLDKDVATAVDTRKNRTFGSNIFCAVCAKTI
jgi:hypothetical protein